MTTTTLTVRDTVQMTPRTRVIRLDLGDSSFTFAAGQAVMAGLHRSPLRRPYSIASAPVEAAGTGAIELLVQLDNSGGPDPHLERAATGTRFDIEGPFGTFSMPSHDNSPLLLVAGGTGIAPLRSMLFEALATSQTPAVTLVYSARSADEFAYKQELDALVGEGTLRAHYTVTRDDESPWPGRRGRVDAVLLAQALPSATAICLICGPPQMVLDATVILRGLGVAEDRVLTDRY